MTRLIAAAIIGDDGDNPWTMRESAESDFSPNGALRAIRAIFLYVLETLCNGRWESDGEVQEECWERSPAICGDAKNRFRAAHATGQRAVGRKSRLANKRGGSYQNAIYFF